MTNKYIEPLVSLVIVGAVFCACLFVILQAEELFDEQLRASVSEPIISKPRAEMGKLLADKTKEQVQRMISSDCLDDAYNTFEEDWNQECQNLGLKDKCSLPRHIADPLKEEYQKAKESCQVI